MTGLVVRCTGRAVDRDGQAVGDPCGKTFARPNAPGELLDSPRTPVGDNAYRTAARAAGWRIGQLSDGTLSAFCPACAKPDPTLVRLCRDLAKETP